jgi:pyrophosphate--fructose-6-phosphate 1-phosphotransferase
MGLVKDYLDILKEKGHYKLGIERAWYQKTMRRAGLDPDRFGSALFRDYGGAEQYLWVKEGIISLKTLRQTLEREGVLTDAESLPGAIEKIYKKSVPNFRSQLHFYGYDGRGSNPTRFDCNYTYNLGLAVFALIANGATGQMAAIQHLEKDFDCWQPIGIPIAPLMHIEERKGKLALVLEKSVVDIQSPAFQVVKSLRGKWLSATPEEDPYRKPGPIRFTGLAEEDRPITLMLNALSQDDREHVP